MENATNNIKLLDSDLDKLKKIFPQYFDKDGNFQLEKFKNNLSEKEINFSTESYGLEWLGKSYARLLASDAATTLLKPDNTHNQQTINKDSQNLLIKGDNLEVLKHLEHAYREQVEMIYIDPPYNTGSDGFVYQDDRKFSIKELQQLAGIDAEKAKRILDFTQSKSNSHSAWLTFMYPRLYIARQLLKDDGVIFVSIDDNEVAQLRLLMDEVFGEDNFRNQIAVRRGAKSVQAQFENIDKLGISYEIILIYTKNTNYRLPQLYFDLDEEKEGSWNNHWRGTDRPTMRYELLGFSIDAGQWRWSKIRSEDAILNYKRLLKELKTDNPSQADIDKWYSENDEVDLLRVSNNGKLEHYIASTDKKFGHNLWVDLQVGKSSSLKNMNLNYFENPKNPELIIRMLKWITSNNGIVLDFFAGSGTTGDAVMQLNSEDGGNRKYILVQLPEPIDAKKNKTAYDFVKNDLQVDTPTIFEITKERLKRAANKIKSTKPEYNGDLGFKVFETMPIWDDYNFEADELDKQQELFDTAQLTRDDIQALLTTWKTYDGIALTQELLTVDLDGYCAYYGNSKLYLMNTGFTTDNLKALLEKIDNDKSFSPATIILFGSRFESKNLREIAENVKSYANKKNISIEVITRY